MWCRYEQSYHRFIENSVRVYLILVENLVKSLRVKCFRFFRLIVLLLTIC